MEDSAYAPPSAELGGSRKGFRPIWLLWGCGGLAAMLLLALASCFLLVKGGMKVGENEYGPVCTAYLHKVEANEMAAAYAMLGPEGTEGLTAEKHAAVMAGIQRKLGPVTAMEVQFVQSGVDQKGRWGLILYKTKFANGPGTLKFTLRKTNGAYKIIGVLFQSPVLEQVMDKALTEAKP